MSKFFKGLKKAKQSAQPIPRAFDEIKQAYNELAGKTGQLQYQKYVIERELEQLNQQLINVNNEAAARQNLDKEAAAKTASQPETSQQ